MKNWFLGLVAATVAAQAQAAIITEQYNFTVTSDIGIYTVGHAFQITATYDNAGTFFTVWDDGPDGLADFGADDDTNPTVRTLAEFPQFNVLSDATIEIQGLASPAGGSPFNIFNSNIAAVMFEGDPNTTGLKIFQLTADDLELFLFAYGPTSQGTQNWQGCCIMTVVQWVSDGQSLNDHIFQVSPSNSTAAISTFSVPEPSALALFGFGLAGVGLARRRSRQASTV